jgi:flavodoxin I
MLNNIIYNLSIRTGVGLQLNNFFLLSSSLIEQDKLLALWNIQLDQLCDYDFENKTIAFIGSGDQYLYGKNFCSALSLLYDKLKDNHVTIKGIWNLDKCAFGLDNNKFDDKFFGIILSEGDETDITEVSVSRWVRQIKNEFCNRNLHKTRIN